MVGPEGGGVAGGVLVRGAKMLERRVCKQRGVGAVCGPSSLRRSMHLVVGCGEVSCPGPH